MRHAEGDGSGGDPERVLLGQLPAALGRQVGDRPTTTVTSVVCSRSGPPPMGSSGSRPTHGSSIISPARRAAGLRSLCRETSGPRSLVPRPALRVVAAKGPVGPGDLLHAEPCRPTSGGMPTPSPSRTPSPGPRRSSTTSTSSPSPSRAWSKKRTCGGVISPRWEPIHSSSTTKISWSSPSGQ